MVSSKKRPHSWITAECISPPHCSLLYASFQDIILYFSCNAGEFIQPCILFESAQHIHHCQHAALHWLLYLSQITTVVNALNFPALVHHELYKIFKSSIEHHVHTIYKETVRQKNKVCNVLYMTNWAQSCTLHKCLTSAFIFQTYVGYFSSSGLHVKLRQRERSAVHVSMI